MELTYFKIMFDNNREFLIASENTSVEDVYTQVTKTNPITNTGFIKLQQDENEPILINRGRLFSIEKITTKISKNYNKVWRLK